jgi:hypothetical protein
MGTNTNIGQSQAVTVFGNSESSRKLIRNHGQLAKIKQGLICPCAADNSGSPSYHCELCSGDGYIYTYQKRFFISDENSRSCKNEIYPYWQPIVGVKKIETVTSCVQGGITKQDVIDFNDTTIFIENEIESYLQKRVSYYYDGWTLVEGDLLEVDSNNGLMYAPGTLFNAEYQSSNPLNAYADIAEIKRVYNFATDIDIQEYKFNGNMIQTDETIIAGEMKADYYYSDLTFVITGDIKTKDNLEKWTNELFSGECRMAFLPEWELSKGDMIVLPACVLYKTETLTHIGEIDRLWEIEIFDLNNIIIDSDGNKYFINDDYILQGRFIKWVGNEPEKNKTISVRYGYKPSYIIFEDNPEPNNLENKQYPKMIFAKAWSKVSKDDITKLIDGNIV